MADITVPKTEEQYINQIYDRQKESTLRTLKSAYDNNVSAIDTVQKNATQNAYEAKRQAAGDAAITRQRLNETFAANGLNTGAVGQANLALLNQKAANLNTIEVARARAQNEYSAQKAALMRAYQAEVESAIAQNDADKAAALYSAWKEQQAQAAALAQAEAAAKAEAEQAAAAAQLKAAQAKATTKTKRPKSDSSSEENPGEVAFIDTSTVSESLAQLNENQGKNGGSYYASASQKVKSMNRTDAEKYLRGLRNNNYISSAEYQTLMKQARSSTNTKTNNTSAYNEAYSALQSGFANGTLSTNQALSAVNDLYSQGKITKSDKDYLTSYIQNRNRKR